ncbi:MAG TPA: hypothetical protein VIL46_04705, partial [Gemmataceae bacterium]
PDLLVRETEFDTRSCPQCGHAFAGIAVCLQGGSIRDVRVYEDGLPDCDVSIIESDGRLRPKPEWDDHPMAAEADGGPGERLVPHPELLGKRSQV